MMQWKELIIGKIFFSSFFSRDFFLKTERLKVKLYRCFFMIRILNLTFFKTIE